MKGSNEPPKQSEVSSDKCHEEPQEGYSSEGAVWLTLLLRVMSAIERSEYRGEGDKGHA